MERNWEVLHSLAGGGFSLELRRYTWPTPNETTMLSPEPMLGMNLGGVGDGYCRPMLAGSRIGFRRIGRILFFPADAPFELRGAGGVHGAIACTIAPALFERLTPTLRWDEERLAACRDIADPWVAGAMLRLAAEAEAPGFASDAVLESAGTLVSIGIARFLGAPTAGEARGGLSHAQLRRIADLVEGGEALSLGEIAERCGLSVRTLTRKYRAAEGRTIGEALAEARIARAKRLLRDRSLPLKVIAHRAGFATASSFTAAFRRAVGVTPGAFRAAL